jgi:hypothetical protein
MKAIRINRLPETKKTIAIKSVRIGVDFWIVVHRVGGKLEYHTRWEMEAVFEGM